MSAAEEDVLSPEQLAELAEMREQGDGPEPLEDDEDEDEDEPEAETVPQPGDPALEKKHLQEARRHENALAKLHPDDWESHVMCPLCMGDGFLLPIPPGAQPDEIWEAVRALSGRQDTNALNTAPWATVCEICDGAGDVLTGSRKEHQDTMPCKRCNAKGWYDPSDAQTFTNLQTGAPPAAPALAVVPGGPQNVPIDGQQYTPPAGWQSGNSVNGNDEWGRWQGHPRYGIDVQFTGGTW